MFFDQEINKITRGPLSLMVFLRELIKNKTDNKCLTDIFFIEEVNKTKEVLLLEF